MDGFRKGKTNLLIATSVAEEGLDVPECNLVIRFQHVSNEIAQVQTEGRARAENSQRITILSSNSKKQYRELKNMELNDLVDEILRNKHFPTDQHLKDRLDKIQKDLISYRLMRAEMKEIQKQRHANETVKLLCKKCKGFACYGSDVYRLGDEGTYHYVVPKPEFENRIKYKDHPRPLDLIAEKVQKTHKIYCAKCEHDWGVGCVWPSEGHKFPVIKCSAFIFQIDNSVRTLKKWKDVPFEMHPLSDWFNSTSFDDSSGSDTDEP